MPEVPVSTATAPEATSMSTECVTQLLKQRSTKVCSLEKAENALPQNPGNKLHSNKVYVLKINNYEQREWFWDF